MLKVSLNCAIILANKQRVQKSTVTSTTTTKSTKKKNETKNLPQMTIRKIAIDER